MENGLRQFTKMGDGEHSRYRIVLACDGIPEELGAQAANDITEEFTHRPWHENVECKWSEGLLLLSAENDYDPNGLALMDEFSDAISACVAESGPMRLVSATTL